MLKNGGPRMSPANQQCQDGGRTPTYSLVRPEQVVTELAWNLPQMTGLKRFVANISGYLAFQCSFLAKADWSRCPGSVDLRPCKVIAGIRSHTAGLTRALDLCHSTDLLPHPDPSTGSLGHTQPSILFAGGFDDTAAFSALAPEAADTDIAERAGRARGAVGVVAAVVVLASASGMGGYVYTRCCGRKDLTSVDHWHFGPSNLSLGRPVANLVPDVTAAEVEESLDVLKVARTIQRA
jgi:hypothetical protein